MIDNKSLTQLNEQLQELRTQAIAAMDEIDKNTDDGRVAELEARHDAIMAEFDKIEAKVKRAEKLAKMEERAEAALRFIENRSAQRRPLDNVHGEADEAAPRDDGEVRALYRTAFAKVACGTPEYDLAPEERSALRAGFQRLGSEQRALVAGTPSAGGYTVPTELQNILVRTMKDWGPMYDEDVCTVITTPAGNPMTLPTVDDTAKLAGTHTEGGTVTDDGSEDPVFGLKTLEAYAFNTEWVRWSFELDADSIFNMETLLGSLLGERMGRRANSALTTGTGTSAPHGIVTASSAGITAASATALTADELIQLQHSVNAAYRRSPKCAWMFADSTLSAIRRMKDSEGRYVFQAPNIAQGFPATVLDKPYFINDDVPAMATGNRAVLFGDFSRYFVRKVGAPTLFVARERFAPDQGILGLFRIDGELADPAAVKRITMA